MTTPVKVFTEDGKIVEVLLHYPYDLEEESSFMTYRLKSDNLFNLVLNSYPCRVYITANSGEWGEGARYLIRLPGKSVLLGKNEAMWNHIHLSHGRVLTEFHSDKPIIFTHLTELEYTFYA